MIYFSCIAIKASQRIQAIRIYPKIRRAALALKFASITVIRIKPAQRRRPVAAWFYSPQPINRTDCAKQQFFAPMAICGCRLALWPKQSKATPSIGCKRGRSKS